MLRDSREGAGLRNDRGPVNGEVSDPVRQLRLEFQL